MKKKEVETYLEFATTVAKMSYARRLKVGAVIAKSDGDIISYGYNGTPRGYDNNCEVNNKEGILETRQEVIHAELNAILKAARKGRSCEGAWLFLTHKPCDDCTKHIAQSGIIQVIYSDVYDSKSHGNHNGAKILDDAKVGIYQWKGELHDLKGWQQY